LGIQAWQVTFLCPEEPAFTWKWSCGLASTKSNDQKKKKKRNSRTIGPGVNEVSFRARPHRSVHSTLGVGTLGVGIGATDPRWRVDSMGQGGKGRGEKREG
jgi:hypothetical protein